MESKTQKSAFDSISFHLVSLGFSIFIHIANVFYHGTLVGVQFQYLSWIDLIVIELVRAVCQSNVWKARNLMWIFQYLETLPIFEVILLSLRVILILLDSSLLNSFIFFRSIWFQNHLAPLDLSGFKRRIQEFHYHRVQLVWCPPWWLCLCYGVAWIWQILERGNITKKTNGFHFRNRFVLYLDFLTCQVWRLCVLNYGFLGAVPASCLQGWGTNTLFHFVSWCWHETSIDFRRSCLSN